MAGWQIPGAASSPWQGRCLWVSPGILLRVAVALMLRSDYGTAPARSDGRSPQLHEVFTSEAICAQRHV